MGIRAQVPAEVLVSSLFSCVLCFAITLGLCTSARLPLPVRDQVACKGVGGYKFDIHNLPISHSLSSCDNWGSHNKNRHFRHHPAHVLSLKVLYIARRTNKDTEPS